MAFNCGRDIEGYDELVRNALSLRREGLHVEVIHPDSFRETLLSSEGAQNDEKGEGGEEEEEEECLIDNALIVFLKSPSEALAQERMLSIWHDAGEYS